MESVGQGPPYVRMPTSKGAGVTIRPVKHSIRIAALASSLVAILLSTSCAREEPPWNVLLVTIDTTRADRIGCYGYQDAHTPNLDALAAGGFLFERCYSTNPITTPSHSSIMTGAYPMLHGVRDNSFFVLPEERTTLAEVFRDSGWRTGAAVASLPTTSKFGLHQGFDFFDDEISAPYENFRGDRIVTRQKIFFDERPAGDVNRAILPWLRENADKPFFTWIHYFDPHQPLQPPAPYDQLFADDPYQGEIAYADESVGTLIETLEEAGVADRTVIIVMSDHGEGLEDHNELTHSLLCYNSTIHVPLIMRVPGATGGVRVSHPVSNVDVAPTILDLIGLSTPEEVQGVSLRPLLTGDEIAERLHYTETLSPELSYGWSEVRAVYDGPFKYIHTSRPELYDLSSDPGELHNLADERPDLAADMEVKLRAFVEEKASPEAMAAVGDVDQETLNRLAALGYIAGGDAPAPRTEEEIRDQGVPPQDRAGDVTKWSSVKNLIAEKKFFEAREIAQSMVDDDPQNRYYLMLLAHAQFNLGQVDDALDSLSRSPSLVAQSPELHLILARALAARGDLEEGLGLAREVADQSPSNAAFFNLAAMYKESGDHDAFVATMERALVFDTTYAPARVALAVEAAKAGELVTAEAELRQALVDGPLYAPAHFNLGLILLDTDRAGEALTSFSRSAELQPTYWKASLGEIAAHAALGDVDAAQTVIEELRVRGAPIEILAEAQGL